MDRISIDDFVRWFRSASRNFHAYPDKQAVAAIFEIESVLSEYRDGLSGQSTQKDLAAAIRPFERRRSSAVLLIREESKPETGAGYTRLLLDEDLPFGFPVGSSQRDSRLAAIA